MFAFRRILTIVVISALALAGCAFADPHSASSSDNAPPGAPPGVRAPITPGPGAMRSFAYLKMQQAMRNNDMPAVMESARTLLDSAPSSRPLLEALGWLAENRYDKQCKELLEAALKVLPDDISLHVIMAEIRLSEGRADKAIALLRQFADAHPDNVTARTELGLLYLKANRPKEAQAIFDRLPASEKTPAIRLYQAQAQRSAGNLSAAASTLKSILAGSPDFLDAMLELAQLEEQRNHYSEARKLYEKILATDDDNQEVLLRLVVLLIKEGQPDKAYKRVLSASDSFGFMLAAASVFMEEGRYDLAASLLDTAAKKPGTPPEIAFYQAAVAYEGQKNPQKALYLLDTVPKSNRFYSKALKLRIQILFETNQRDQALAAAKEAQAQLPAELDFSFVIIEILTAQKKYPEAQRASEELMRTQPNNIDLAIRRAFLLDLQGHRQEALAAMEDLLKRTPDNPQIMNYIGYTLADENRDLNRAIALLTKAVELEPDSDYILDSLAWAYYRLGKYQDAWTNIRRAMEVAHPDRPKDATMWDHYGDIAKALGLKEEARKAWRSALESKPDNPAPIRSKLEKL